MRFFRAALTIAGLFCAFTSVSAQIVMREIIATGNGGDPSKATIDAIENAISQVGGMRISTATSLSMSEASNGGTTTFEENFKQCGRRSQHAEI